MANRVVLGMRGSAYGLWISKPGFNVLTTGDANMLFSMTDPPSQVVQAGLVSFALPADFPIDISIPNLGYNPIIVYQVYGLDTIYHTHPNNSTIRFHAGPGSQYGSTSRRRIQYAVIKDEIYG